MSSPLRVGLVGHRGDPQLARLITELEARGVVSAPFDLTDIPAHVAFHWEGGSFRFGELELASLDAVYARTAHFPMPTFVPGRTKAQSEELTFPVRESGSLMNSIISELDRRMPLVNPPSCYRYHPQKPFMYRSLQEAGVPVPRFAVGCDLAALARFSHELDEQVVIKPLMGGEVRLADLAYLKEHHAQVDRRPFLLQRRILGRSLRASVVGQRVVAAAEMVHGDVVDWRNDLKDIRSVELGPEAADASLAAARALGLLFAAVDLEEEHGPGGTPWVIDVNPGPMFAAFEARSGLDVAGPLSDYMKKTAASGSLAPDQYGLSRRSDAGPVASWEELQ